MSTYIGLYVRHDSNGQIVDVQVIDPGKNSISLAAQVYVDRAINPPIKELPNEKDYRNAQNLNGSTM
jgi:hypothetical protein